MTVDETPNIDESKTIELILDAALNKGIPEKFFTHDYEFLRKDRKKHPMIVITGASRTGATLLGNSLLEISKLNWFRLSSSYFNNENDLYLPALCIADRDRCLSVLHMRATLPNCAWIRLFGIKVVISVRNIFDLVVTLTQYIRSSKTHPNFMDGYSSPSMMWFDGNQEKLSDEALMDMVVDLYIPWIIQFYVSWYTVTSRGEVEAIWVTFEDLKKDTDKTVQKVLDFCELEAYLPQDSWQQVYANNPKEAQDILRTFKNDVPRSYWEGLMTNEHQDKIRRYAEYYPDVNFTMIGL